MAEATAVRWSRGRVALAGVFALLALNAWAQAVLAALGRSDDPPGLVAFQCVVGACAAAAATGTWRAAPWAPAAAALYGVVTAAMLVSLESLLDLGARARGGLWTGAALLLAFGLGSARWLRRQHVRHAAP